MTYIIEAQTKTGNWLKIIEPCTTNENYALLRAEELSRQPGIAYSLVSTINNTIVKEFINH